MKKKIFSANIGVPDIVHRKIISVVTTDVTFAKMLKTQLENKIEGAINIENSLNLTSSMPGHSVIIDADSFSEEMIRNFFNHYNANPESLSLILIGADKKAADLVNKCHVPFLQKPFRFQDLLTLLQRPLQIKQPPIILAGSWIFSPIYKVIENKKSRELVNLTEKEASILQALSQLPAGLTADQLLQLVWGYRPGVKTQTLATHIYRLRQKLSGIDRISINYDPVTEKYLLSSLP